MRAYGALSNDIPQAPDRIHRILLTGGSSAQAMDWGTTLGHIVRVTPITTLGSTFVVFFNPMSTDAAVPSSGTSQTTGTSAGSSGNNHPVVTPGREFLIPPWSTGFSVAAYTSGFAILEVWSK